MALVVLLTVMTRVTRMKGGSGWVVLIIVATTVPAYLTNLTRNFDAPYFPISLYLTVTLNVIFLPFLWFFVRRQFDNIFHFRWRDCLHFIPAIDSVYPNCGFRSRSAFFAAFKKFAGSTPIQWLTKNE